MRGAEQVLRDLGFRQFRVRNHGQVARIEVEPQDLSLLVDPERRARITQEFHRLGYTYVTLDLVGYRTGSMNAVLAQEQKA